MGTYPPRECGIATFNQDLLNSSQKFLGDEIVCSVAAMNLSPLDAYVYPREVKWRLDQDDKRQYLNLAKKFNGDPFITGIIIQHEYGIYGGADGANILEFMENCTKPIIVTLHTVLPDPSENMKKVTERIIKRANVIIVLTANSKKIMESVYPEAVGKLHVIPHGIHATAFSGTKDAKKKLKLKNKIILSTFGLLNRGKGIEYMIKALPKIIEKHPSTLYLVLGETHPVVRRSEGESYRNELSELVVRLHLKNHVKFYDQYLSLTDLIEFLKATDIYISTSINPNQAVSGTLSYALGTGRTTVSTEFAQAKEIITKDTGRLVPIMDPDAFSRSLNDLLGNKSRLKKMHRSAYLATRPMLWSSVAKKYSKLLTQNILPPINLTHLKDMTDEYGLFQFAEFNLPNKKFGYTLDDNARALVVCSWLDLSSNEGKKIDDLSRIYLRFIERCQLPDGSFVNYFDHAAKTATGQNKDEDLEDATARAMWALSEVLKNKTMPEDLRNQAKRIFIRAVPHVKKFLHVRSSALLIKAFANILQAYPEYRSEFINLISAQADLLVREFDANSSLEWSWFDSYLGYNNGVMPEALLIAGQITNVGSYTEKGRASLMFLIHETFSPNRYRPVGHSKWYKNKGERSNFDQQPEDPASMILALVSAYEITHDDAYRKLINTCFSWFLGNNILQTPLYVYENGGCYDGLHPDRVNLNQGAESLISYLLSRLSVAKLNIYGDSKN